MVLSNARVGYRNAILQLVANDDVSGVGEMMISTDPSFSDGLWQPFETELSWWVAEAKSPSVYVKFRDRAGNESITYSD
jgi:hypothetical protein